MLIERQNISISLLFLWAGLALGGNLIAAPAKFQVKELSMAQLLEVGRAQFSWLGTIEWVIGAALVLSVLFGERRQLTILVSVIILFLVQQLWAQPMLRERTDIILAGGAPPEGKLHLTFIGLEIAKFIALIVAGFSSMKQVSQ